MPRVFLNYRNVDGEGWAAFLDYRLRAELGRDAVFRASRSIKPADDFVEALLDAVRNCSVLVSIVGPTWETVAGGDGRRRLDSDKDWVRRELAEAFRHGIPVLPVLVSDARPLNGDTLPPDIAPLANCQYVRLGHRNDEAEIARIVEEVRRIAPDLGPADPADQPVHVPSRTPARSRDLLTRAEWLDLLSAFYSIEHLWDRERRRAYIERAEHELGRQVPFPRRAANRDDIDELVAAWLDHPGALYVLMSVLTEDDPHSPGAEVLRRAVSTAAPAPMLTREERLKLDRSIGGIDQLTAVRAFALAFGASPPPMRHEPTDLPTIVADLEEVVTPPGQVPPLVRYLRHLAEAPVASLVAIALRELVDEIGSRTGVRSNSIAEIRRSTRGEGAPLSTFLDIWLLPDGASDDRYLVKVETRSGHRSGGQSIGQPDEPMTITQVEDYVDQILTYDPHVTRLAVDDLWIRFTLPRSLLDRDVDQWKFGGRAGFARRLGAHYRVTIRSLERQLDVLREPWQKRCERLPSWEHARFDDAVHWIDRPGEAGEPLLVRIQDSAKVCMAFGFAPPAAPELGDDEYAVGLHAGIPVLVWSQDAADPDGFREVVRDLVDAGGIAGIPANLLRLRRDAVATGRRAGVTVVFEPTESTPRLRDRFRSPA